MEKCANCERNIGNLEQFFKYKERKVCSDCFALLSSNDPKGNKSIIIKGGIVTTELTAKKWKKLQLIGAGLVVVGIVIIFAGRGEIFLLNILGICSVVVGLIVVLYAIIKAWWHHG